jgi:hypothetical protein
MKNFDVSPSGLDYSIPSLFDQNNAKKKGSSFGPDPFRPTTKVWLNYF